LAYKILRSVGVSKNANKKDPAPTAAILMTLNERSMSMVTTKRNHTPSVPAFSFEKSGLLPQAQHAQDIPGL
jgi:hypothetical protein